MVHLEVIIQRLVVQKVLRGSSTQRIAKLTPLVLFSTMNKKLVVSVESLVAKRAYRMTLESSLIYSSRIVISLPHMLR